MTTKLFPERSDKDPDQRAVNLMNLANEAYHVAYGMSAMAAQPGTPIHVQTAVTHVFDEFFEEPEISKSEQGVEELIISSPSLSLAGNFEFIRDLAVDAAFIESRNEYLTTLMRYLYDEGLDLEKARKARTRYVDVLSRFLSKAVDLGLVGQGVLTLLQGVPQGLLFVLRGIGVPDLASAPLISFIAILVNEKGIPYLGFRLRKHKARRQLGRQERRPQIMKPRHLAVRKGIVSPPLKEEICKAVLSEVGPYPDRVNL